MAVRRFRPAARVALFLAARGRCARCGERLAPGWHADHVAPVSRGGATEPANGQALCPRCNLAKGARRA
ncbi:MAG TPA: HNH endonuclease signature motif containing protein [Solirubrobacter sp.]|nr:HNH endonuclease signature motif containing protein [Solirubrobacter sp.]